MRHLYLICITVLIYVIICKLHNRLSIELFSIPKKDKPYIWMYWDNKPGKQRPEYLDVCLETIQTHCKNSFNIIILNKKNVYNYLPNLRKDLWEKLVHIPMITDYIRYLLLYTYGGIWLDFDIIMIKDIMPLYKKLNTYDFIGFGCYFNDSYCMNKTGYPGPANWCLISRKKNILFKKCISECDSMLDNYPKQFFATHYHIFGKNLFLKLIKKIIANYPDWKYYHMPSKCMERDSTGTKTRNHLMISNKDIDPICKNKYYFIPVYNTAPGFPDWFYKLNKKQLLTSRMLISKFFRLSLNKKKLYSKRMKF